MIVSGIDFRSSPMELRHASTERPLFVIVPERRFLAIDGIGRPGAEDFRQAKAALRAVSDGASDDISAGIAIREGSMLSDTCYSAWYYLPTLVTVTKVWLFYKFRSRSVADQPSSDVDMWDLDVVTGQNQALVLSLYRHDREEMAVAESVSVPVERWFQLESCLLAANDSSGHLRVWLDGASAFELTAQLTMPSQYVEWNVGSIGEALNPVSASVYVDDAAVSTRRLGPNFPVFWRAP